MKLTKQILYNLIIEELEKGAAYKHKSKKGKESTVKVVDPKNQHGAAVVTKVNPQTLDPLSKRVFAVNPEKFEATAEPIEGDAADDGQCGPGKKFNGRTGEPCPAEDADEGKSSGDAEKKIKEREAQFKKEMEEIELIRTIGTGIFNRYMQASDKYLKTKNMNYYEWSKQLMNVFKTYSKLRDSGNAEEILKKMKNFAKHA